MSTFAFIAETTPTYRAPGWSLFWCAPRKAENPTDRASATFADRCVPWRRFVSECVCVAAFTVDFVARAATCPSFKDFRGDIMNWVDFIAIVPFYVELLFKILEIDPGQLSSLRIIRVLRLARVLKVIQKAAGGSDSGPSMDDGDEEDVGAVIGEIVSSAGGALVIPLYFMLLALIVFASLEYYIERTVEFDAVLTCTNLTDVPGSCSRVMTDEFTGLRDTADCPKLGYENCTTVTYYTYPGMFETDGYADPNSSDFFTSIPEGFWWCIVTMTTVGYGDKYPLSWMGQIIATCTAAVGIFFISMPLAIVGSSFANSCDKLVAIQA
eukprot:SAG31_NODE_9594_length_1253_cov_2.246967_1_plen_324_part_10